MGLKKLIRLKNQGSQRDRLLRSVRNLPALLFKLGRGLKTESGRSLPAALITLAVGSMLLTPFLSFVSARSLGTRAATETFNEQYASDAGVEFGIWSLLNNPAFRTQVDINAGTPQPLAFPSPINVYTPTVSVTGLPIGSWYLRQFFPSTINSGGSLAYAGGDRVYGLRGNSTTTFGYYSISADQWFNLANTPNDVGRGGALVYPGGNFLYALRGNNQDDFWRYNISTNNWAALEDTLNRVSQGGSLVFPGGSYLYALRGNSNKFWRYNISSDTWSSRSNTPERVGYGADLIATGGNTIYALRGANNTNFWRYNITTDTWSTLHITPERVTNGGSLAYYGGNYIYALQGNSTAFWRYTVTMNSWTVLANSPSAVGRGGALEFTHSQGGFAFRGGGNPDFWEFGVTPPRYDISSQAGSVDTDARFEIDGSTKTVLFWDID
jgi:hypothetical protein